MSVADSPSVGWAFNRRSLFVVAFEVVVAPGRMDDYLGIAAGLRPGLLAMPGFLANERFASRVRQDTFLSLSLWDDEKAMVRWRVNGSHHAAQEAGREAVFVDYRLRVGEATRCVGPFEERAIGWARHDVTAAGPARWLTVIDAVLPPGSPYWDLVEAAVAARASMVDHDVYDHLQTPGRVAIACGWPDERSALDFAYALPWYDVPQWQVFTIRVIRDYGMRDRHEAPQYYEPALQR